MKKKWEQELKKNEEEWKQLMQKWLFPSLELIQQGWKGEAADIFLEMGYELAEEMGKYAYWWDGSC